MNENKSIAIKEFLDMIGHGGVAGWNRWLLSDPGAWLENKCWDPGARPPYPLVEIDLSDCDLSGLRLDGVILDGACLMNANFQNASLRNARLRCVEATSASFAGADLRGADLTFAIIHDCDFTGALCQGSTIHLAIENQKTCFCDAKMSEPR